MDDINVNMIADALNNKADRDLNNIESSTFRAKMLYPIPDYSREVQITAAGSVINYTVTENGVIIGNYDDLARGNITCNGFVCVVGGNDSGNEGPFYFPVMKGDNIVSTVSTRGAYFIPYKWVIL